MEKIIILVLAGVILVMALYIHGKTQKEGMAAGFGTISGLSANNRGVMCFPGNDMGSSNGFCTNTGYVLV